MERTVLLAAPRSFCAGVERAIEVVERMLADADRPVYVRKQAGAMGFFEPVPRPATPAVKAPSVWTEQMLAGYDFAVCAGALHPDGTAEELDLGTQWLSWGTYADDWFPQVYGPTRDLTGARVMVARLKSFMPLDLSTVDHPANPLEAGLTDLWQRTAAPMEAQHRTEFRAAVDVMLDSWVWELQNQHERRIADPVDYIEMRRRTFGSDLTMSPSRFKQARQVPPEVYATRSLQNLEAAASDYACFVNDLYSYQKEIEFEGELHNIVLVVENFLDVSRTQAAEIVRDLMTSPRRRSGAARPRTRWRRGRARSPGLRPRGRAARPSARLRRSRR
ncbi:hypothetical protein OHA72_29415 [Dactylosporangium sp. NBC_01737]|uniref:terpene synthase family protein n=1 Tax=Dactylosporangium sp. NBC_01737 TaxID=2975959 RepID=UPI002E131E7B|nr:hypothetical protein OHA72_29415 [Dactylosporangium sp. NBC_01737]